MKNFLHNTPFFRLTVALSIGIIASFFNISIWWLLSLFLIGVVLFVLFFLQKKEQLIFHYNWIFGLATFLTLFSIGGFLTYKQLESSSFPYKNKQGFFIVKIIEQPIDKPKSTMIKANVISLQDSSSIKEINKKAIIYLEKDSLSTLLKRGDVIIMQTSFYEPKNYNNPESFNYKDYLKRKGIEVTAYCKTNMWQHITYEKDISLYSIAEKSRLHLLNIYKKFGIKDNEFGIIAALTLGYKDALSPELRESFSTTGAMHVLAVSGLHVGIIFVVLGIFLKPLGEGRKRNIFKNLLIILLLWIYAFITGLSPSVCRATLMFSLVAFANIFNRQSSIYNTIFFSAFVLLLINPSFLLEVGFQLSYCAVIAIVYFQPKFANLWHPKNKILKWCWDLACVSIVAQIGTAPFAMYYFHQFPNYFLLSNFIVIPAASILIYLAITLFLTSFILYIGASIAFILNYTLKFLYLGISGIEHLPNALTTLYISKEETLILYSIVIVAIIWCEKKNFASILTILILIVTFCSFRLYNHYQNFTTQEVVIFKHNKANIINFVSGNENIVITNDSTEAQKLANTFWLKKQTTTPIFIADSVLHQTAIVCNDKRYLCLTKSLPKKTTINKPIEIDNLVIGRKIYVDSTLFTSNLISKEVTISECVPFYCKKRIKGLSDELSIKCIEKD